jgi:hypothetical protein
VVEEAAAGAVEGAVVADGVADDGAADDGAAEDGVAADEAAGAVVAVEPADSAAVRLWTSQATAPARKAMTAAVTMVPISVNRC